MGDRPADASEALDSRFVQELLRWFDREARSLPWRNDRDSYRIWVSEIMLQQTTVKAVLPYFERFIGAFPTVESLARADLNQVLSLWSGLGYYSRARNLHKAAQVMMERFAGSLPDTFDEIITLPGIGRYTAGAILSISHGRALPVVDGNVRRVLARFLAIEEAMSHSVVESLWRLLDATVRSSAVGARVADFNQALMELGALICTPRNPSCRRCPISESCRGLAAGLERDLPVKKPRRSTVDVHCWVAVVPDGDRFLMRRNAGDAFLNGFWDFPRIESQDLEKQLDLGSFLRRFGLDLRKRRDIGLIRHQITFRRIHFHAFQAELNGAPPTGLEWVRPGDERFPVAAPVSKIVACLTRSSNPEAGG